MSFLGKAMRGCLVVGSVVAISACGSSSSSSSSASSSAAASGGSSGGKTIDIYSSLPLQGAVNVQTIPVVNGIKLALAEAGGKAGQFKVNYISLDDSTATSAATTCDVNQSQANARRAATDPKAVLLHRRVQLGLRQGHDSDPQPGGRPPDQPGEHLRRPDHERPGQCPRASRRSTTRPASGRTCGSFRETRSRPRRA